MGFLTDSSGLDLPLIVLIFTSIFLTTQNNLRSLLLKYFCFLLRVSRIRCVSPVPWVRAGIWRGIPVVEGSDAPAQLPPVTGALGVTCPGEDCAPRGALGWGSPHLPSPVPRWGKAVLSAARGAVGREGRKRQRCALGRKEPGLSSLSHLPLQLGVIEP